MIPARTSIPDAAADPNRLLLAAVTGSAFLVTQAVAGPVPAIVVASTLSGLLVVGRWRPGRSVGVLLPLTIAYLTVRAVVASPIESEVVYFGVGLVVSGGFAVAVLATAFTPRPLAADLLPVVVRYRPETVAHPHYGRVAARVTAGWALAELAVTGVEAWHLRTATAAEFLGARALIGWPSMAVVVVFCLIFYVRFALDPIEHRHVSGDAMPVGVGPERVGGHHRGQGDGAVDVGEALTAPGGVLPHHV